MPAMFSPDGDVVRRKTTSSYLGWTERKPKGFHDKFDHTDLPGGAATSSYENYVKGVFKPGFKPTPDEIPQRKNDGISASAMIKMERVFGKYALEAYEDEAADSKYGMTPRQRTYIEMGMHNPEMPTNISHYSQFRELTEDEWKRNNKQSLIDYKDFNSAPLSPYLYQNHPYIRSQDSRIVGSNFVQVTTRPKDRFLEKIEATLKEVNAMPRYYS